MKKLKSYVLGGLGLVFIASFQNCGNNQSTSNSTSAVGTYGVSYSVVSTASSTLPTHGVADPFSFQVQLSGTEAITVKVGLLVNGNKDLYCTSYSSSATTSFTATCNLTFPSSGTYTVYAEIDDESSAIQQLLCTATSTAGCNGTFSITAL